MRIDGWCPYCGHEELETSFWHKEGTWFVRCRHCRATGPSLAKSEQEAIRLFMTRADGPVQGRLSI